ncbi:MAG: hypothetical protein AB7U82_00315 [Blastocatellales bacterium]
MRTIRKRPAPNALAEWRAPRLAANRSEGMECDYEQMRRSPEVLEAVEDGLFAEQGGICAYTGHRIGLRAASGGDAIERAVDFHIEHMTPQKYCKPKHGNYGKDADYENLAACWPRPNCGFEPAYGAKKKGNWPAPENQSRFVSPLLANCSARFGFNRRGEIIAAQPDDEAASETIKRLGLNHSTLAELRREAIRGALNPASRPIKLAEARKLLQQMRQASDSVDQGVSVQLMPFCFAIQPALEREIRKLEAIRKQK